MTPELLYYPRFEPPLGFLKTHLLFSEKIHSIIPKNIKPKFSDKAQEFFELMPDTFDSIPPIYDDKVLNNVNLKRIRFFFDKFSKPVKYPKDIKLTIGDLQNADAVFGNTTFSGYSPLYNQKLNPEIRELLDEYNLIDYDITDIAMDLESGDYCMVEENASNLVVSHIADKMGNRTGLSTITNNQTDYTVSTLNSLEAIKKVDATEGLLSSLIINMQIPSEIHNISNQKYRNIRNAYSDIREPFRELITDLNNIYRLNSILDEKSLLEKIETIVKKFNLESEKFNKTRFIRQIKDWTIFGIGSLGVLGACLAENQNAKVALAMLSITVTGINQFCNYYESDKEKIHRLISGMQGDIIDASKVRSIYLI